MTWRDRAACLGAEYELFFPVGISREALAQTEEAKAVCRGCAVQEACLKWALDAHEDHGVWGGLSEDERRPLTGRRIRMYVPHGTSAGAQAHIRAGQPPCPPCREARRLADALRKERAYTSRGAIAPALRKRRVL